jgi:DNA-binding transcriptional LysR family regulator
MHPRSQHNVPVELLRTVVAISETGSFSKAAGRLGLSQPAISSQIKRFQALVAGRLFEKTPNGTAATDLGKLVLHQARRILEANDQLMRLGGTMEGAQPLRLGLSTLFVQEFIKHQTVETLADIFIHTDHSVAIAKGLIDGYVDIACIYHSHEIASEVAHLIVNERQEPLIWVRARDFIPRPGAPISVLAWPGDDWMIRTLRKNGTPYKIAFNSPDYHAKLLAVEAGIGVTAIPASMLSSRLVAAKEYYLPQLPPITALLCARSELPAGQSSAILKQLSALFFRSG